MLANKRLKLIARISAWLLLLAIAVSVFSGWGITRTGVIYTVSFGLIDRGTANAIHRGTQIPMVAIFLIHVLVNVKIMATSSSRVKNAVVNGILITVGLLALALTIIMEQV